MTRVLPNKCLLTPAKVSTAYHFTFRASPSHFDKKFEHDALCEQQAIGACWYLLGIQRATNCLNEQCIATKGCGLKTVGCANPMYYGITTATRDEEILSWANNVNAREVCLVSQDKFEYGTYTWTVLLVTNSNRLEKILLPIFWGLMNLT